MINQFLIDFLFDFDDDLAAGELQHSCAWCWLDYCDSSLGIVIVTVVELSWVELNWFDISVIITDQISIEDKASEADHSNDDYVVVIVAAIWPFVLNHFTRHRNHHCIKLAFVSRHRQRTTRGGRRSNFYRFVSSSSSSSSSTCCWWWWQYANETIVLSIVHPPSSSPPFFFFWRDEDNKGRGQWQCQWWWWQQWRRCPPTWIHQAPNPC